MLKALKSNELSRNKIDFVYNFILPMKSLPVNLFTQAEEEEAEEEDGEEEACAFQES